MSKRTKWCTMPFCDKKFKNRSSLRAHLVGEHNIVPSLGLNRKATPVTIGKPQRRIRMMQHAAMCQYYRNRISKLKIPIPADRVKESSKPQRLRKVV